MITNENQLLTAEELAIKLKISPRTLWRLLASAKIPEPIRFGGNTRWRLFEIETWIGRGCPSRDN